MSETAQTLDFQLPNENWAEVPPPEGTAFQAVRRGQFEDFRPNMAVYVSEMMPGATLEDVANDLAGRLSAVDPEAWVHARKVEEGDEPYVMQSLTFHVDLGDLHLGLAQWHTVMQTVPREADGTPWALAFTLTALASDIVDYGPDYQAFIASGRPVAAS